MDSLMQVTREEGALAGAIHVGSFARRRGREEHQGRFVLLQYQGSHAHTITYKHFSSPPMQPACLSLKRGPWLALARSWLPSHNLPVFSLGGVVLADALPQLPSTLKDQEGSRVETGAFSLTAAFASCTL
ncbi:hypothetical protein D1007_46009 [Hordeum vulgare]|nr:hypothetical protein D1007_46009 [Hordeum vulgare]